MKKQQFSWRDNCFEFSALNKGKKKHTSCEGAEVKKNNKISKQKKGEIVFFSASEKIPAFEKKLIEM